VSARRQGHVPDRSSRSQLLTSVLHSRIGPDQFVSRMARLREDPRFRAVQPDAFETEAGSESAPASEDVEVEENLELWFDWAFVDFWKNHYCELRRPSDGPRSAV
jgi:hypothetical protein